MKLIMAYVCHGPDGSFLPIIAIIESFRHEATPKQSTQTGINSNRKLSLLMHVVYSVRTKRVLLYDKLYVLLQLNSEFSLKVLEKQKSSWKVEKQRIPVQHRIIKSNCALCVRMIVLRKKVGTKAMVIEVKHKTATSVSRNVNFFVNKL